MTGRGFVVAALAAGLSAIGFSAMAAPPLETFGKLPAIEEVDLSPNGSKMAFAGTVNGQRTLTVVEIGGAVIASSPLGITKLRDVTWAGDDIVVVANTSTRNWGFEWGGDNQEFLEVVSIDLKSKASFPVFKKARALGPVFGRFGLRQLGGRWYGFFGGYATQFSSERDVIPLDEYRDLFKVDLSSGDVATVVSGHQFDDEWQVGPDGSIVAYSEYVGGSGVWNLFTGARHIPVLTRPDRFNDSSLLGLGRTPGTVIVGPAEGEEGIFTEVHTDGAAPPEVLPLQGRVRELIHDRLSGLLIGYGYGRDNERVVMFDPKINARVQGALKAFPNYAARLVSWSEDFGRMVVFTNGGDDPGSYWLVDIATGKATALGSEYAIDGKDVGAVRMIDYKAADGTALQGVLTLPPGSSGKGLPLVVLPHGGPASRDYAVFDWWAQAFASRGYAVFQPNFRGSTGYGKALHDAGFGEWGRKMQTDVSDGVAALAAQGIVDPKRACIVGASYGGYAALAGVTVQHGLYRCAVSYAGVADLPAMLTEKEYNDPAMRYWKTFMGAKGPNDAALRDISPASLAAKADAPVLLIHGKDDTVVNPKQSQTMERELKRAGKPVELITLDGEDHWLSRGETRTAMLKAAVAFVEKNNPAK